MANFQTYRVVVEIMDTVGSVIKGRQQIVRTEIAASEDFAIKMATRAALRGDYYMGWKVTKVSCKVVA
jgi:hypothetical protein